MGSRHDNGHFRSLLIEDWGGVVEVALYFI